MASSAAAARLRRTFRYPTDDDDGVDEDGFEGVMDEEEQDHFITTLTAQNAASNRTILNLLFTLPCLSSIPFLVVLFRSSTTPLLPLLSLTSLLSTTYLLHRLPPTKTGLRAIDVWAISEKMSSRMQQVRIEQTASPLERYLPYLNATLCVVICGAKVAGVLRDAESRNLSVIATGLLPGLVYGVVLVAKVVMAGVDPKRELGRLRYEYKGA